MSDLNWNLRDILYAFKDSRLSVFVSIFLHKNIRNRSWPSNELIATETGLTSAPISAAIGWLIESHVVVLVPYEKRIGLELKLPNRKNIYQLTGVVLVGEEYHPYMSLTPEGWLSIAADLEDMGNSLLSKQLNDPDSLLSKCLDSKRLDSKRKGIKELDSEVPKRKAKGSKKDSEPDGSGKAPRPRDLIFDALVAGYQMGDDIEGGRVGAVNSWLKGGYTGYKGHTVRAISHPATVDQINLFFKDWNKDNKDSKGRPLSPPLDLVKFVENWSKWAKAKNGAPKGFNKGSLINAQKQETELTEWDLDESLENG